MIKTIWTSLHTVWHFSEPYLAALAVLGGALYFLSLLMDVVPRLASLKAKFFAWFANTYKYEVFKRKAISSDIEALVNSIVFSLQDELPKGWIKRASIKWVRDITRKDQAPLNEIILRMRPIEDQNTNLLYSVHAFFGEALFPKIGHIIPLSKKNAATLLITRRALESRGPSFRDLFEEQLLEKAIQENSDVLRDFSKFEKLDNKGFFTSALLREVHTLTNLAKFNPIRTTIDNEINSVTKHMLDFSGALTGPSVIPEPLWSRKGPITNYAFLLVARPDNNGSKNYVLRAKQRFIEGVTRLYVLAKEEQRDFAKQVIKEIGKLTECNLEETFELNKDYRCNQGGLGAILTVSQGEQPATN